MATRSTTSSANSSVESTHSTDTVLSLQDMCKLKLIFHIELFPTELLARLPTGTRTRLFQILPIVDRLHCESALQDIELEDIRNTKEIKERLIKCLFIGKPLQPHGPTRRSLGGTFGNTELAARECGFDLFQVAHFLDCLHRSLHISTRTDKLFTRSLEYIKNFMHYEVVTCLRPTLILPARVQEFLSTACNTVSITDTQKFLSYCNLHTTSPNSISIDTVHLLDSKIWIEYDAIRNTTIEELQSSSSSTGVPMINPVSPLLQNILACVEHLSIGTIDKLDSELCNYDYSNITIDAPNFILTNIVSHEKPCLKSIHIHGIGTTIDALVTIGKFLCGVGSSCPVGGIDNYCYTAGGFEYSLVPPTKSCSIEKLVITTKIGFQDFVYTCAIVSRVVERIIHHQRTTLKHLSLGIEFISQYEDGFEYYHCANYCSLLNTTLVDFVQLSEFECLELDGSPDSECYPLMLAFMTTPASHEQKLVVSLRPDSKPTIPDELYPIPTAALPQSNIQFKSLVLNGTERSELVQRLFGFPDLSLRFLQFSTVNLEGKVPSTGVNIESLEVHVNSEVIDISKLDVFISENPVLKHLTISQSRYGRYNSSIFSVVNECLLRMVNKRMTLDSITLQEIQLLQHIQQVAYRTIYTRQMIPQPQAAQVSFASSDEQGYDFSKWIPSEQEVILGTWFASLPNGSDNIPSEVHDKDIFLFLCLVQKLNATLTMASRYYGFSEPEPLLDCNLIPSLEKAFRNSNVKIRKIVTKGGVQSFKESFMRIASTVETAEN